jgi:protein SOK2
MQQPNTYHPQPTAYMPNTHYSPQPAPYDAYPPHQSPYGMPHFTHSPHPPSPYGHHFPSEYHHDPFAYTGPFRNYVTDPSGQSGPPGMKPRVTTTLWEDEGTLCFQVEAKGICVARREGNAPSVLEITLILILLIAL